jgi:hypothetical protein
MRLHTRLCGAFVFRQDFALEDAIVLHDFALLEALWLISFDLMTCHPFQTLKAPFTWLEPAANPKLCYTELNERKDPSTWLEPAANPKLCYTLLNERKEPSTWLEPAEGSLPSALHFQVKGNDAVRFIPYFEVQEQLFEVHGARFSAEIYTRGCHWIPRMFA